MGTSGLVAQAFGARNFREVGSVFVRSVSVALLVAVLLLLFRHGIGKLAFRMMEGSTETRPPPNIFISDSGLPRLPCRYLPFRVGLSACRTPASQCSSPL